MNGCIPFIRKVSGNLFHIWHSICFLKGTSYRYWGSHKETNYAAAYNLQLITCFTP